MTEQPEEIPAQDEGDQHPDSLVGEEVEDDLELDLDSFEDEDEDDDEGDEE